jgi:hypothetical protein
MGASHSIYMANESGRDIYVMVALNPDWAMVDYVTDLDLMAFGVTWMKALGLGELPEAIRTLSDAFTFLQTAGRLLSGTISAGPGGREAAMKMIDAFKQTAVRIPDGDYRQVEKDGFFSIYLKPDGIASLMGAHSVSILVMSSEGTETQVAMWNSGADASWIAKNNYSIARSKHGTIWQQDFGHDSVGWPLQNSESDKSVDAMIKAALGSIRGENDESVDAAVKAALGSIMGRTGK